MVRSEWRPGDMTVAEGQSTRVPMPGGHIEVAEIAGDSARRPLVLLHEGLGSVGLWRDFPEALAAATARRVITYSRFGHGQSDPPSAPRTASFFREEALEVLPLLLDRLGAPEPILVGHSDGASIALIHAAHHTVSGLVLLAPHVFVEDVTVRSIRATREEYLHGDLRERMVRRHADPDTAFWGWCDVWLDPEFRSWSLEPELDLLSAPALLIQGREDPYGTLDQLERIERHSRGTTERLVLPGGHTLHREDAPALAGAIARFVEALP
jgi:pimeloyl-ACP methyl ester carboxylesterase